MKALPSIISALLSRTSSRMNILALVRFVAFLAALITAYSVSIARLRGAYMQAKLQELQEYVENNS